MSEAYALDANPVFDVNVEGCEQAGSRVASLGGQVASGMDEVIQAWRGVTTSFNEPGSNHLVDRAMTSLNAPSESIRDAAQAGDRGMGTFTATVVLLKRRQSALELTRARTITAIDTAVKEENLGEAGRLATAFNDQVRSMQNDFENACTAAAQAFKQAEESLSLEQLPEITGDREALAYPRRSWSEFTGSLDEAFKKDVPLDRVAERLKTMNAQELKEWARTNPEIAGELAGREVNESTFKPGTREAKMLTAMRQAEQSNNYNVDLIGTLWNQLSGQRQAFLLMAFPALFGNMNGIPFKDRIKANKLTVTGEKYRVEQRLKKLEEDKGDADQIDDARRSLAGLNKAIESDLRLVNVSGEGDGRFAALTGDITRATTGVAVNVPGTTTDGSSLGLWMERTQSVVGTTGSVGVYWQNADLPDGGDNPEANDFINMGDTARDNITVKYMRDAAPKLAAFDAALDRELGGRENTGGDSTGTVRTTYLAHSAGASILGTAEAYGLDSSAEVYVAPAGVGNEDLITDAGGRKNRFAQRYQLQAPEDPIGWSQGISTLYHGGDPREEPDLSVQDLEPGYKDHENGGDRVTEHNGYYDPKTTAMKNMRGVVKGDSVLPRQGPVDGKEPFEQYPERYKGKSKYGWVPVESVEDK